MHSGVASLVISRPLFVGLLFLTLALPVSAQTGSARLQGTVKDSSNAVLPAATVRISNLNTGIEHESVSNSAGFYVFQSLT